MDNYKTKRLKELKDFITAQKTVPCRAPIMKIISNIDRLYDVVSKSRYVPARWIHDHFLTEFEIVPLGMDRVFVKRGYPYIQFHVASWESLQPTISFFLDQIPDNEHHYIDHFLNDPAYTQLSINIPQVIMVQYNKDLP